MIPPGAPAAGCGDQRGWNRLQLGLQHRRQEGWHSTGSGCQAAAPARQAPGLGRNAAGGVLVLSQGAQSSFPALCWMIRSAPASSTAPCAPLCPSLAEKLFPRGGTWHECPQCVRERGTRVPAAALRLEGCPRPLCPTRAAPVPGTLRHGERFWGTGRSVAHIRVREHSFKAWFKNHGPCFPEAKVFTSFPAVTHFTGGTWCCLEMEEQGRGRWGVAVFFAGLQGVKQGAVGSGLCIHPWLSPAEAVPVPRPAQSPSLRCLCGSERF